jgi:hypothetical protein
LVLVVRAIDDQSINESLEEDSGSTGSSETSTCVENDESAGMSSRNGSGKEILTSVAEVHTSSGDLAHVTLIERHTPNSVSLRVGSSVEFRPERIAVSENSRELVSTSDHHSSSEGSDIDHSRRLELGGGVVESVGESETSFGVSVVNFDRDSVRSNDNISGL